MKIRKCVVVTILFSLILYAMPVSWDTAAPPIIDEYVGHSLGDSSPRLEVEITSEERTLSGLYEIPPSPQFEDTIAIIVENLLYSSIGDAVNQYRQDLNDSGYNTLLYTEHLSTAEELKGNLTQWYEGQGLRGAVLIGRLPYAQFHHPAAADFDASTFICDLFLMDLDGVWTDTDPENGIYDGHSGETPTSDIFPEIFVGRIDPTCLSWSPSVADEVNNYLARIHDYRTGGVQRTRRAIVYIDDDWAGYPGTRWANDVGLVYGTRMVVQNPTTWTNATDWKNNRLSQDYQWGHLCAHSDAATHAFGPEGAEGYVTSTEIHSVPPSFNFYNLFCCSGAKWTVSDNLAVAYTFTGPYSLASIGSSKTGSMMDCEEFYGPLAENATLGASLKDWFSNSLNSDSTAGTLYLEWYYGMNIIGDPLLTTYYDCTVLAPQVYSTTHQNPGVWYSNTIPQFNWTAPPDVNTINGYYYILDQNPTTVPVPETAVFTTSNGVLSAESLSDGLWYLHVVARDSAGNIGNNPAHYAVRIDTTAPAVSIVQPNQQSVDTESILIVWSAQDIHSGYSHSEVWVDVDTNQVVNGTGLSCFLEGLNEGTHTVNVTVYDRALNRGSVMQTILIDLTNPVLTLLSPTEYTIVERSITLEWYTSDLGSGYQCTEIRIDGQLVLTTVSPSASFVIEELAYGTHSVNLTAFDWVNRTDSIEFQIVVQQPAPDLVPLVAAIGIIGVLLLLVLYKKKG